MCWPSPSLRVPLAAPAHEKSGGTIKKSEVEDVANRRGASRQSSSCLRREERRELAECTSSRCAQAAAGAPPKVWRCYGPACDWKAANARRSHVRGACQCVGAATTLAPDAKGALPSRGFALHSERRGLVPVDKAILPNSSLLRRNSYSTTESKKTA